MDGGGDLFVPEVEVEERRFVILVGGREIDPLTRPVWVDQTVGCRREVWRPGDGDGDATTGSRIASTNPNGIVLRWKFFQSPTTARAPPRYVHLDDLAVWGVVNSEISKVDRGRWWPHDFTKIGEIRFRRRNCGRPAIIENAVGKKRVARIETKSAPYYLRGDKFWTPVRYVRVPVARRGDQHGEQVETPSQGKNIVGGMEHGEEREGTSPRELGSEEREQISQTVKQRRRGGFKARRTKFQQDNFVELAAERRRQGAH